MTDLRKGHDLLGLPQILKQECKNIQCTLNTRASQKFVGWLVDLFLLFPFGA
jgi:hypothetical protein